MIYTCSTLFSLIHFPFPHPSTYIQHKTGHRVLEKKKMKNLKNFRIYIGISIKYVLIEKFLKITRIL